MTDTPIKRIGDIPYLATLERLNARKAVPTLVVPNEMTDAQIATLNEAIDAAEKDEAARLYAEEAGAQYIPPQDKRQAEPRKPVPTVLKKGGMQETLMTLAWARRDTMIRQAENDFRRVGAALVEELYGPGIPTEAWKIAVEVATDGESYNFAVLMSPEYADLMSPEYADLLKR